MLRRVDASPYAIEQAAEIIRRGGLVAFPTETVYGLGANACDRQAVVRIYEAKGRPSDNPLILHVNELSEAEALVSHVSENVKKLAETFWPGPLTMIMHKKPGLLEWLNNGMATVAIRVPSHPVARELIRLSGCVIAAPSANLSGRPSPTCAAHVLEDMDGKIDMLIDGGVVNNGLESTVVDMTGDIPHILRPGVITPDMLASALGMTAVGYTEESGNTLDSPKSPGMKYKHYAPHAEMTLITGNSIVVYIKQKIDEYDGKNPLGIMVTTQTAQIMMSCCAEGGAVVKERLESPISALRLIYSGCELILLDIGDGRNPLYIGHNIYTALRAYDAWGVEKIYAEGIPETGVGLAVMNRLKRASGGRVIRVDET